MANDIAQAKQQLQQVAGNPAMKALMAVRGFTAEELERGAGLVADAEGAFLDRQSGLGVGAEKKKLRDEKLDASIAEFADFRVTVRLRFDNPEVRKALGAGGRVVRDVQKHALQATAGYQAAFGEPYATSLAQRGWPAARLHAAKALIEELLTVDNAFRQADGDNSGNTSLRDTAFAAMVKWMVDFRAHPKIAFRTQPAYLEALGMKKN